MKEDMKKLDAGIWMMEFFTMEQRGTMYFWNCWREGICKETQTLLQSTQPATNTKYLHKKWLRNLVPLTTETQKNKIIEQNKNVLPRYLKQIDSKIFKQSSF